MYFLLGRIGRIASQVAEVLYAGDIDVAGGNLYPVFVCLLYTSDAADEL